MGKAQRAKDQVEREDWMVGDLTDVEVVRAGLSEGMTFPKVGEQPAR